MSWETAVMAGMLGIPVAITYLADRHLQATDEQDEVFYFWMKIGIFIINLGFLAAGLWIAQMIAALNDAPIATLIGRIWIGYIIFAVFIMLSVIVYAIVRMAKQSGDAVAGVLK